jgi:hypothetical protein
MRRCVDFTYPNPSLWLIDSAADIWYRVCGPLVPGGGHAHPSYAATFNPYMERFAAAAHVAFCLIDFYPSNKKLSLHDVTTEVTARSGGRIDQAVIFQNCEFIYEQVASLSHPDDWDNHLSFGKSACMVQLKKKGETLKRPTKQNTLALHRSFAPGVPKSVLDMSAGGVFGVGDDGVMLPLGKNSIIGDPVGTERNSKGRPILLDERDLMKLLEIGDKPLDAFPSGAMTDIDTLLHTSCISKDRIPSVLKVWSILMNFKYFLNLPHVCLEDFIHLIESESNGLSLNYLWADSSSTHPFLREIHIALLVPMVMDRSNADSFTRVVYAPPAARPRALDSYFDKPRTSSPIVNSVTLWETLGCQTPPPVEKDISQILRAGDTWVEAARLFLSEKVQGAHAPEYADPVGELHAILTALLASPHTQHFTHPGVACVSEGNDVYSFVCPDDFTCIMDDIQRGLFECGVLISSDEQAEAEVSDDSEPSGETAVLEQYDAKIAVGDRVDAYSATLRVWSVATVVCILPMDMGESSSLVQVSFEGWGSAVDETYGSGSFFLAPAHTLSEDMEVKHMHPDHIPHEKTYMLMKKFREKKMHLRSHGLKDDAAAAVLARVKAVFNAAHETCKELPENSDLYKATVSLQCEFEEAYSSSARMKSAKPVKSEKSHCSGEDDELLNVVSFLSTSEYKNMDVDLKIGFLEWLCNEMLSSESARKYLEEALEKRTRFEKESKQRPPQEKKPESAVAVAGGGVCGKRESFSRASRGKRTLEAELDDDDLDISDNESSKPGHRRKSVKLKASGAEKGAVAAAEVPDAPVFPDDEMLMVDMRMEPIGRDRNGTLYWLFACDSTPLRIFCELLDSDTKPVGTGQSSQWKVISGERSVRAVAEWLSEFGQHESQLKAKLLEMVENSSDESGAATATATETVTVVDSSGDNTDMAITEEADESSEVLTSPTKAEPDGFKHHLYHHAWFTKESYFHLHELHVMLNVRGQMEMGVKDLDGRIIITAYKYNEALTSCAKDAGARLGDQIISVNCCAVRDIASLQMGLKTALEAAPMGEMRTTVRVLILRHSNPLNTRVFRLMHNLEADLRSLVAAEHQILCTKDEHIQLNSAPLPEGLPTRVCGMIAHMLYCSRAHFVASNEWSTSGITKWIQRIGECYRNISLTEDKTCSRNAMIDCLKMCLLDTENALATSGRVLDKAWSANRFRYRWRNACSNANTFAKISLAAVSLHRVVNWESIEKMSLGMERSLWQQLVPTKSLRTFVPNVNERVIVYADGELATRELMARHDLPELPPSPGISAYKGKAVYGIVRGIKHFSGGPSSHPAQCFPFYRMELHVVHELPDRMDKQPVVITCKDDTSRQTRIFNRILNVLYGLPEANPFVSPVLEGDAPDYYVVVTSPMHLTEMTRKVKNGAYTSLERFLADVELIRANCELYCEGRYPALIPLAQALYDTAAGVIDKLREEYGASQVTGVEADAMEVADQNGSEVGATASAASQQTQQLQTALKDVAAPG